MKGFRGSSMKVEPGFYPPAMPMPNPMKAEAAFAAAAAAAGHPYLHQPQPFHFPFLMPRPFLTVGLPPVSPFGPFPQQSPRAPPAVTPESEQKHRAICRTIKTEEEPPVLDLSVKKAPRLDSPVSQTVLNCEPEDYSCDLGSEQEQGVDLSCPDKQNGGKTFKKALLNRYHSKFMYFRSLSVSLWLGNK